MTEEFCICLGFPSQPGKYKIVQIYEDAQPLLIFGKASDLHCFILEHFLRKRGIEYKMIKARKFEVAALGGKDERYKAVGFGYAQITIDEGKKIARFSGDSYDYALGINKEHIEFIKKLHSDWMIT